MNTTDSLLKLKTLLQSKEFALNVAKKQQAAYQRALGQTQTSPWLPEDLDEKELKSVLEQRIATNLAGFYALECGIGYLVKQRGSDVEELLSAVVGDLLPAGDKELLCRFANATWKAGQPFRSLDRITREVFVPFDLLSEEEKVKDWVQIQNAAKVVLSEL
jgi:hypothetical protein